MKDGFRLSEINQHQACNAFCQNVENCRHFQYSSFSSENRTCDSSFQLEVIVGEVFTIRPKYEQNRVKEPRHNCDDFEPIEQTRFFMGDFISCLLQKHFEDEAVTAILRTKTWSWVPLEMFNSILITRRKLTKLITNQTYRMVELGERLASTILIKSSLKGFLMLKNSVYPKRQSISWKYHS